MLIIASITALPATRTIITIDHKSDVVLRA